MRVVLVGLVLLFFTGLTWAESYHFLGRLRYAESDVDNTPKFHRYNGAYYFESQQALGPWDQFSYVNRTSNIQTMRSRENTANAHSAIGEFYFSHFGGGLGFFDYEGQVITLARASIFVTSNFKSQIEVMVPEEGKEVINTSLQYQHNLEGGNFVGFTSLFSNDLENSKVFSLKYFGVLSDGKYFTVLGNFYDDDVSSGFEALAKYYFNVKTGVSLRATDEDVVELGLTHFFNKNYGLEGYAGQYDTGFDKVNVFTLGLRLQF